MPSSSSAAAATVASRNPGSSVGCLPALKVSNRLDSPDNDSAFSDNGSMLSSEGSSVGGGSRHKLLTSQKVENGVLVPSKPLLVKISIADGSTQSVQLDPSMSAGDVLDLMVEANHVQLQPSWGVVEQSPELYMERCLEDDENVMELLLHWKPDSKNRLLFVPRPQRYDLFRRPERYLMGGTANGGHQWDQQSRQSLLHDVFYSEGEEGDQSFEIEGPLWVKAEGKKSWKKQHCLLHNSGLYCSSPRKKDSKGGDMVCLAQSLSGYQVYLGLGWKKKHKAPSEHCLALKPPSLQCKNHREIKYLCAESDSALQQWVAALRIAKGRRRMLDNYNRLLAKMQTGMKEGLYSSVSRVEETTENPKVVKMNFVEEESKSSNGSSSLSSSSNGSVSSGCVSETEEEEEEEEVAAGFDAEYPEGGTIRRKQKVTSAAAAEDDRSVTPTPMMAEQQLMMPPPPPPMEVMQRSQLGGSDLSLNSLPPPPEELKFPLLYQQQQQQHSNYPAAVFTSPSSQLQQFQQRIISNNGIKPNLGLNGQQHQQQQALQQQQQLCNFHNSSELLLQQQQQQQQQLGNGRTHLSQSQTNLHHQQQQLHQQQLQQQHLLQQQQHHPVASAVVPAVDTAYYRRLTLQEEEEEAARIAAAPIREQLYPCGVFRSVFPRHEMQQQQQQQMLNNQMNLLKQMPNNPPPRPFQMPPNNTSSSKIISDINVVGLPNRTTPGNYVKQQMEPTRRRGRRITFSEVVTHINLPNSSEPLKGSTEVENTYGFIPTSSVRNPNPGRLFEDVAGSNNSKSSKDVLPPRAFLNDLQRVMQKKWAVAQKFHMGGMGAAAAASAAEQLSLQEERFANHYSEREVSKWILQSLKHSHIRETDMTQDLCDMGKNKLVGLGPAGPVAAAAVSLIPHELRPKIYNGRRVPNCFPVESPVQQQQQMSLPLCNSNTAMMMMMGGEDPRRVPPAPPRRSGATQLTSPR